MHGKWGQSKLWYGAKDFKSDYSMHGKWGQSKRTAGGLWWAFNYSMHGKWGQSKPYYNTKIAKRNYSMHGKWGQSKLKDKFGTVGSIIACMGNGGNQNRFVAISKLVEL